MSRDSGGEGLGIMGVGVVGGAMRAYFEGGGRHVALYDRDKGLGSLAVVDQASTVFMCVPTPYTPGRGFDDSALAAAVGALSGSKTIVIKSTVLPGTTERYQLRFPKHRFLFNPEFLREASAVEDFAHPDRQIVGCTPNSEAVAEQVMALLPAAPYSRVVPARAAELAKYMANAFLAIKVTFANEMYDLASLLGTDYDAVRDAVAVDERIGPSHLDVLHDGYRGYGGKCLPKDTKSLLDLAREHGVALRLLEAADRVNDLLLVQHQLPGSTSVSAGAGRPAREEQELAA
jgi:UDPglucose 6-dehydrogenase